MTRKDIGKIVSQARKEKGLNQDEASKLCNTSPRHYSSVENGGESVSIKTYDKVSKALKIAFDLSFPLK